MRAELKREDPSENRQKTEPQKNRKGLERMLRARRYGLRKN